MSGPQGYDPTQPRQPQHPGQGDEQGTAGDPEQQWQPPAYTPPQYGGFPQPGSYPAAPQYPAAPGYPPQSESYGQQALPYEQYGPQPGSFGPVAPTGKRPRALIGMIVGACLGVVGLMVALLGFWKPGFFVTTKLDVSKAQEGVQQILTDQTNGYGAKNVQDVKCNNGQSPIVKQGNTFTCDVSIDGTQRQVSVTFQDNSGTYEVGRPK